MNNIYLEQNKNIKNISNISQFVEKNKDLIISILKNENIQYCKASLLYRFLILCNITYTEDYIINNGNNILLMLLDEFNNNNKKEEDYNDKIFMTVLRKDNETMKKMNSIDYILNNN